MNASVWTRSFVFVESMVSAASVRFGVYSLFLLRFVRYEIVCWEWDLCRLLVNCWLWMRRILVVFSRVLLSFVVWLVWVWCLSRSRSWITFWSWALRSWWIADCRRRYSSSVLPSLFIMLVCWFVRDTSVLAVRWWTLLPSWSMWTQRSTFSSLRTLPMEVVVLDVWLEEMERTRLKNKGLSEFKGTQWIVCSHFTSGWIFEKCWFTAASSLVVRV